ncbi:Stk1 family PASTA domain-containing Ser/Thr kinase [Brochothrix campestris]|uniref:Stk1 family PASTA domain-containing Ser/Thr kinase n=1 Tax=Brochothrix campestris TaxID=2757 RepID=UPI0004B9AAB6|nr:Stk1 family PASTA domain-containing Ser/Thr kinase [Brochothrix campestris]
MIIGKRLSGRYEITRLIGTGGMSNVYLARDIILERDVAVKLMRMSMANEEQLVRRFRREAQATTQLMHPHIVDIFDVDEDHDNHFIVMEYIDGMDLKAYINKKGRLPLPQVITIMNQILGAIAHAHHQQIIHRDIKPQNVLINHEGTAKITDFGIAMALFETSMTQTNTTLGSVHYLSPEQARGGIATTKSDVYSLGIMLYEMLTGKLPFDGESAVAIAIQQLQSPMPLLADELPSAPMSLQNIVMKATAKDAANRYLSVEEMQADLATALQPSRINEAPYDIHKMDYDETQTIPLPSSIIKEKIADIEKLSAQKPPAKRKPAVIPKDKTG